MYKVTPKCLFEAWIVNRQKQQLDIQALENQGEIASLSHFLKEVWATKREWKSIPLLGEEAWNAHEPETVPQFIPQNLWAAEQVEIQAQFSTWSLWQNP